MLINGITGYYNVYNEVVMWMFMLSVLRGHNLCTVGLEKDTGFRENSKMWNPGILFTSISGTVQ
jgi:hypothetical protein